MKFLELVLQNFGPYLGKQVINLSQKTEESLRPIILIGGMNGGGKTTLMDGIRLALYGQRAQCSTRGNLSYSDFLTQCVNRNTPPTEKTRIELAFELIQEDQPIKLRIIRYWEANPKDGKDTLGILENDEWPDKALVNTWDEYIENILPLGISNLFLFDGEQVKELAEMETTPPLVTEAIQSLLGLELADRLSKDLEILLNRKRREMASNQELLSLDEIAKKLGIQKDQLREISAKIEIIKKELQEAESQYRRAQDKFIYEGGKIARDRSELDQQKNKLNQKCEQVRENLRDLSAGILPLILINPLLTETKKQVDREKVYEEAQVSQTVLKERDSRLLNYLKKIKLSGDSLEKIKIFLAQENEELQLKISESGTPFLAASLPDSEFLDHLVNYQLIAQKNTAYEKINELENLERELQFIERQIMGAASPEAYQLLENTVREAQNHRGKIQARYESLKHEYEQLEKQIKQTQKELENFTENNLKIKSNQDLIVSVDRVQKTLALFKQKLTLRKLNKLENEVTECFRYLLHKSDLVHRVTIDSQTFCLSLYDPQGLPLQKHRLSAGEKQLLAIAFLWGLARVSGRSLPVAIDTPLGRLDSSHRQNLIERYFPSASHQVILLSTDTEIGEQEIKSLRAQESIAREYLLHYHSREHQTTIKEGYFW